MNPGVLSQAEPTSPHTGFHLLVVKFVADRIPSEVGYKLRDGIIDNILGQKDDIMVTLGNHFKGNLMLSNGFHVVARNIGVSTREKYNYSNNLWALNICKSNNLPFKGCPNITTCHSTRRGAFQDL